MLNLIRMPVLLIFLACCFSPSVWAENNQSGSDARIQKVRLSAQQFEALKDANAHEKFMALMRMPEVLSPQIINEIDFSVRKLAFYRVSDRQNKRFNRSFYELLEQKMTDKFLQAKRFAIHECFECKTTKVLLKQKQFSILRQLDSNQSLAEVGEKIGVDSFVLWDAFLNNGEPALNIRIVSASDGQVRWSKQYESEPETEYDWEFYTSFWDLQARRDNLGGGADAKVSPMVALGVRAITRSTISNRLYYGYGAEVFFNTVDRDLINVWGATINGRVALEFDETLGLGSRNYGNWLFYASIGQGFIKLVPTVQLRTGLEIRLNKRNFIDLGVVSMMSREFDAPNQTGYANTAELGGAGYDITIGIRF